MKNKVRIIDDSPHQMFKAICGNVIGVVERPAKLDPLRSESEQLIVKIGVLDQTGELPRGDAERVIEHLRIFCSHMIDE